MVYDTTGVHVRDIELPTIGSIDEFNARWTSKEAFYEFTSFPIPQRIYRYDIDTGNQSVWAETHVPIHGESLEIKQVWYSPRTRPGSRCSSCTARGQN